MSKQWIKINRQNFDKYFSLSGELAGVPNTIFLSETNSLGVEGKQTKIISFPFGDFSISTLSRIAYAARLSANFNWQPVSGYNKNGGRVTAQMVVSIGNADIILDVQNVPNGRNYEAGGVQYDEKRQLLISVLVPRYGTLLGDSYYPSFMFNFYDLELLIDAEPIEKDPVKIFPPVTTNNCIIIDQR